MQLIMAFADLVLYIEETRSESLIAPIYKLSDLVKLYSSRFKQFGTNKILGHGY